MKRKKKLQPTFAVYNFPYFRKDRRFWGVFAAKALLIALTSGAGAYCLSVELGLNTIALGAAAAAGIASLAYFVLLSLFRQLYVDLFTVGVCVIGGLFFHEGLYKIGEQFIYHVLIVCNGKFVNTTKITAFHRNPDAVPMMMLFCIVFGILCAFSFYHRYHPEGVLAVTAIMLVPSFLSLTTHFDPSIAFFAAGNMGLWAMSSSLRLNTVLMIGGPVNTYALDGEYQKASKKLTLKERLKENSLNYGRFFQDAFMTFLIASVTFSLVGSSFPQDSSLKFDEVIKKITENFQNMEGFGFGLFPDLGFGGNTFSGYFSADGGKINISGSINPNLNSKNQKPVLEVITQNQDKLYLKGDIGYKFDGRNWESISEMDYSRIYYSQDAVNKPIDNVFQNYIPELELLNARSSLYDTIDPEWVIGSQTVKINYLKKMNTVLFAGTPFIYNFRDNNDFTVTGDFVALADRGKINSMETAVLYPKLYGTYPADEYLIDFNGEVDPSCISYIDGLTEQEYLNLLAVYKEFIRNSYLDVPQGEQTYIESFIRECFSNNPISPYTYNSEEVPDDVKDIYLNYNIPEIARCVESYLSVYGKYEYSTSTDNFNGEKTPIGTFLTETKAGHCAMYATTMCLALRYLGIPARYVTGFTVGAQRDSVSVGGGSQKYTLAGKDLHAWVEVYYDNVGWIPYDPTPAGYVDYVPGGEVTTSVTTTTTVENETTTTTTTSDSDETEAETQSDSSDTEGNSPDSTEDGGGGEEEETPKDYTALKVILIVLGSVGAVAVIILAVRGGLNSLKKKEKALFKFFKNGDGANATGKMLSLSLKLMKIKGISRKKGETPAEFGERADEALKLQGMLINAIPLFEREEFDHDPSFTDEEQKQLYVFTKKLARITLGDMKNPKRLIIRIILFGKGK